jgi:uncharacterized protein YlxW (UPF0749 family)
MPEAKNNPEGSAFSSPLAKLVKFFEKSRNKWKTKYKELKYKAKLLSNQVRYLKNRNAELEERIKRLEKELGESGEKKTRPERTKQPINSATFPSSTRIRQATFSCSCGSFCLRASA